MINNNTGYNIPPCPAPRPWQSLFLYKMPSWSWSCCPGWGSWCWWCWSPDRPSVRPGTTRARTSWPASLLSKLSHSGPCGNPPLSAGKEIFPDISHLFLCPAQGLENQEVALLSESWKTVITGRFEVWWPTKPHLGVGRVPAGAAGSRDVPGGAGGLLLAQLPAGVQ